jgi:hypothetical protein
MDKVALTARIKEASYLEGDFLLTRRSRNQKSYKLSFTQLDISPTIAQTQIFDTENLNDAKFCRATQH